MLRSCKQIGRQAVNAMGHRFYRRCLDCRTWLADVRGILGTDLGMLFDVGANVGQTASIFCRTFPHAEVHSFEPGSDAFGTLSERFGGNPRVFAHQLALGSRSENKELHRHKASAVDSLLPSLDLLGDKCPNEGGETIGTETVQVIRLDDFCKANSIGKIDLLKIDTQGFEIEVLKGCGDLLSPPTIRAVALEVNLCSMYESQTTVSEVFDKMSAAGYGFHGLYEIRRGGGQRIDWCDMLFLG